jgi:hypothetical protein
VVEATTLTIAYRTVSKAAKKAKMELRDYIAHGPDQTAVRRHGSDIMAS